MTSDVQGASSKNQANAQDQQPQGLSPYLLGLRAEVESGMQKSHPAIPFGQGYRLEVREGTDALWLFVLRGKNDGGIALRTAYAPGPGLDMSPVSSQKNQHELRINSALGVYRVQITLPDTHQALIHCTVSLTPATELRLPYWPRDLYVLDADGKPGAPEGIIEAAQRGLNAGLVYAKVVEPELGSFLYFQDLTTLNPYFLATDTKPDGAVGGKWPELGYEMPVPNEEKTLPADKELVLSDVFLSFSPTVPEDERQTARLFLDLLASIYPHLTRPDSEFHPWPERARETLRDLEHSPKATVKEHGYTYLHPYTDTEYPDAMVQLAVLTTLREYEHWNGVSLPFADELRKAVPNFFDIELNILRRYLPSVGEDKNADEVDSWYLYHPLANLGRLARWGDEEAKELFFKSLPFAIKVAQHFQYNWPIQYDIKTLEIIKATRKPGDPGQSDVGGLYANVMLLAHELTNEEIYLTEARAAIDATREWQFELAYQMNITAWGFTACLRLWRLTKEPFYLEQSYVFLASFFHNCVLWDSQISHAKDYLQFMGLTCLHDGPYMAIYECYESLCALGEYLELGAEDLPESVRLLCSEVIKYTLGRAWHFYPDNLPKEALATEVRNGHIDRTLTFPIEDLYADGQPAGQVGQEIYGAGAAFALTTRHFHRLQQAPLLLYCEYPIRDLKETKKEITFRVAGIPGLSCRILLITPLEKITLHASPNADTKSKKITEKKTDEGHLEFMVDGGSQIHIR